MTTRRLGASTFWMRWAVVVVCVLAAPAPPSTAAMPNNSPLTVRLNLGSTDPILDPALLEDSASVFVADQLFLALVRPDEETGVPLPELATAWVASPNADVFTFTLRSGVTWSDGNPLTAYDARYGLLRTLDPTTASPNAGLLFWIQNAEEYNTGVLTDANQVGVSVLDYTHLRFNLKQPAAFFPSTLVRAHARPMPAWAIAAHPTDWTEPANIVTSGAYKLLAWSHGISMTLGQNPNYYDATNVQIEHVAFTMVDDMTAWGIYQAGQLDSALVPSGEWNAAENDPLLATQLHIVPALTTYFHGFNTAKAPFDNSLVRKAFIAAIDREAIVDLMVSTGAGVTVGGMPTALTVTGPGVWGYVDGAASGIGIPYNVTQAQQWLAAAGYPNGTGLPPITLVHRELPHRQAMAELMRQNWSDNLGVTVTLSMTTRSELIQLFCTDPPQIWSGGWGPDFLDAYEFLNTELNWPNFCGRLRYGNWLNPTYESLVNLVARTNDLNTRASLYQQAEEILVETDAIMLPTYYFSTGFATKPYLSRTYGLNLGGLGGRIAEWRITWRLFLPLVQKNP